MAFRRDHVPTAPPPIWGRDVEERLMRHVRRDPATRCWRWTRYCTPGGYGQYRVGRSVWFVHRLAHLLWVGPIPEGWTVDHVYDRGCRYRDCINPAHLEAVPAGENTKRAWAARQNS